jgi:hypothetical protein
MGSDSRTTTELIEVTQRLVNGQTTTTTAQTSICEHLVVVPEHHTDGGFTGGFIALHVPTSLVLRVKAWVGRLTPTLVDDAILGVSHLDWSNPDPDFYLSARGTPHRQAWATAVNLTATDHYSRPGEPR